MKEPSNLDKFLNAIPRVLAGKVSIFIFIFLFVYLVIFGLLGLFITSLAPTAEVQLILGNYTNVTSALGAAIAAGASTAHLVQSRKNRETADKLKQSINDLHAKVDKLSK